MDDDYDDAHEAVRGVFRCITGMRYVYVRSHLEIESYVHAYMSVNIYIWMTIMTKTAQST